MSEQDADTRVPSPASSRLPTAEGLLARIREHNGRVYRMHEPPRVFCLTSDARLAEWLARRGARPFVPPNYDPGSDTALGSYERARGGTREWDLHLHTVPLAEGSQSLWEACG